MVSGGREIRMKKAQWVRRSFRFLLPIFCYAPRWEYIRRIRRSPAFGSIVFFPIIAAILIISNNGIEILNFRLYFGVPINIHLFYWAIFCLFFGTTLYYLRCPDMFVRYETKFDYVKSELEILRQPIFAANTINFIERRLREFGRQVRFLESASVENLERAICKIKDGIERQKDDKSTKHLLDSHDISELLLAHWRFMNRARLLTRLLIAIFYNLGLMLIALITLRSVSRVLFLEISNALM